MTRHNVPKKIIDKIKQDYAERDYCGCHLIVPVFSGTISLGGILVGGVGYTIKSATEYFSGNEYPTLNSLATTLFAAGVGGFALSYGVIAYRQHSEWQEYKTEKIKDYFAGSYRPADDTDILGSIEEIIDGLPADDL